MGKTSCLDKSERKRPLDFSNGLVYNLLRKVIGIEFPIALSKRDLKNKHSRLWAVEDAYFFLFL